VEVFDSRYRALIFTAAWTGLRWRELAGLHRDALDLDTGQLHIRTALTKVDGHSGMVLAIKDYQKSDSGRRTIGLTESVVAMLREHLENTNNNNALLFPGHDGGFLHDSTFRRRQWTPAVKAAGLQPLTFHDLRHTHASLLIRYGWQEFKIVRRLGWKDATMLHRTYGHLFPQHDSELLVDLEEHLRNARSGNAKVVSLRGR
jgi:integrase